MLLRLYSDITGDVLIYDLSVVNESDAITDFYLLTEDEEPDASYLDFESIRQFALAWWARTGCKV
jgi:hypothetical protein